MSAGGAILAGGQLASNILGAKKAKKTAGNQQNAAVAPWLALQQSQDQLYRQALASIEGSGKSAKADILENQKGLMAGTAQSMASRGLYNTTALDSANRGIAHSTNRSLAQLSEDLGLLKANLFTGLAQAKAVSAGGLSGARMGFQNSFTPNNFFGPLQQMQSFQSGGGFGSLFGGGSTTDGGFPTWGTGG